MNKRIKLEINVKDFLSNYKEINPLMEHVLSILNEYNITEIKTHMNIVFSLFEAGPFVAADTASGETFTKNYSSLTPGIYTVYCLDDEGCTSQSDFEI